MQGDGYPPQPVLSKQRLSFWALTQQRRRKKRPANLHRFIVTPSALLFGQVTVSAEKDLVVRLVNKTTRTVTVSAVNITAATPGDWAHGATLPFNILANGSATITMKLTPSAAGLESAAFDIVTTAGTITVQATGTGV